MRSAMPVFAPDGLASLDRAPRCALARGESCRSPRRSDRSGAECRRCAPGSCPPAVAHRRHRRAPAPTCSSPGFPGWRTTRGHDRQLAPTTRALSAWCRFGRSEMPARRLAHLVGPDIGSRALHQPRRDKSAAVTAAGSGRRPLESARAETYRSAPAAPHLGRSDSPVRAPPGFR